MLPLLFLIATAGLSQARPDASLKPIFGFNKMRIFEGTDASPGEIPWQLSQQRLGGSWSHSCGAVLIGATRALSVAHCVDGASASILRVIAGLHKRSDTTGTQISNVASYVMHEGYNQDSATFANDIAILNLAGSITPGGNVAFATLAQGSNDFAGTTCVISGWGRTSSANTLPDTLQQASIPVISTAQCQSLLSPISATIGSGHICVHDSAGIVGPCDDSGSPLNCPNDDVTVVAGVYSWGVSSIGTCRPEYPSVYTRVSFYYGWISNHMYM